MGETVSVPPPFVVLIHYVFGRDPFDGFPEIVDHAAFVLNSGQRTRGTRNEEGYRAVLNARVLNPAFHMGGQVHQVRLSRGACRDRLHLDLHGICFYSPYWPGPNPWPQGKSRPDWG